MDAALWIVGRATGVVALLLFTLSVVLGITNRSGRALPGLPRFSVTLVHRNVALLSATFLAIHVGTLLFDSYAQLRLLDLVLPFFGAFKPLWQGLGTVALDLTLAVIITSAFRHRIGLRVFRIVHWLTYAIWPIALIHALGNGTDAWSSWFLVLAATSVAAVGAALVWRLSSQFSDSARSRQGALG